MKRGGHTGVITNRANCTPQIKEAKDSCYVSDNMLVKILSRKLSPSDPSCGSVSLLIIQTYVVCTLGTWGMPDNQLGLREKIFEF